jgi:hypothetical protein
MGFRLFLTTVLVVALIGVWSLLVLKWAEWADWWHDLDTARQSRLGKWRFLWMKTVSWLATRKVRVSKKTKMPLPVFIWLAGSFVILVIGYVWPPSSGIALTIVQLVGAVRYVEPEPEQVVKLRTSLAAIIGTDAKGQPPRVALEGEHPAGGPGRMTIVPYEGWKFWGVDIWNNIERAVEKQMHGDWEKVFESDERIVYERMPELPTEVVMTRELLVELKETLKLPWWKIPVGPDGLGGWVCVDLREYAHWLITGDNGSGKTSWMGWAGTWLLLFPDDVDVAIIDIKGFGLKRFKGRQGVVYEALPTEDDDFEVFENAFGWIRREVVKRKADLTQHDKFHKPLVVLWDEAEETISDAHQFGAKTPGVEHPTMVMNAMTAGRLARELRLHLLVGTQRADGTSIPTKFRAQLRGRVHFGPTDQKGAEMAVGTEHAPRLVNLEGPIGRGVVKGLNWIKNTQGIHLVNYLNDQEPLAARKLAESLLPGKRTIPLPDWDNFGTPEPAGNGSDSGEHDGASQVFVATQTVVEAPPAPASIGNGKNGSVAEGPLEVIRRNARQRKAAQRKQDREVNKFDPTWRYHGTWRGYYDAKCRCPVCKAWKVKADQPVPMPETEKAMT